jgi:formylglycine-generating enzyme required for sulfatase activity
MTKQMNFSLSEEPTESYAEWQVERFVLKFQPQYRDEWQFNSQERQPEYFLLAQYAALPVILTPDLLNYLRDRFLPQVNWIAEADLLLSDLCRSIGFEQYILVPEVREILLAKLQQEHAEVLPEVARKVINYSRYLAQTNSYITHKELRKQEWSAMGIIVEEQQNLANQISLAFVQANASISGATMNSSTRREMEHLASLVQEFAPSLQNFPALLAYSEQVTRVINHPELINLQELRRSYTSGGLELPKLEKLIPEAAFLLPENSLPDESIDTTEFEFDVAEFIEVPEPLRRIPYEFEVATIELQESRNLLGRKSKPKVVINRRTKKDWQYVETLEPKLNLELIKIPAGSFMMGAAQNEFESEGSERPQHPVNVSEFYMGKHPITQDQWRFGANLPRIDRELDPDLSRFKGQNLPVERVSWLEAIEFCARLSVHTGREYSLPSEAEWEYACRAGTVTPFHFGETIDPQVANYDGGYVYGRGRKGIHRSKTIPVGSLNAANEYGLHDVHGNVWEWCQDHWHNNYQGAPENGSAWINTNAEENKTRVLRGGSWFTLPRDCRSAARDVSDPVIRYDVVGFRVVSRARTS